jgi:hypothetical protein
MIRTATMSNALGIAIPRVALAVVLLAPGDGRWLKQPAFVKGAAETWTARSLLRTPADRGGSARGALTRYDDCRLIDCQQ